MNAKELVLSVMAFVLLLTVFCIVALTASWTDKGADDQVGYLSSGINESVPKSASTRNPINHFSENGKEPVPDATCSSRTDNDADVLEMAIACPNYRVNYHRKDPNDLGGPDACKNDSEDADDIVE